MADCEIPTYRSASFKGRTFHCDSTADELGRRSHLYEYPLSEDVGIKDLGRKARRFRVEGYLIGSDQVAQTVAIANAAESPEPGPLIHPMYGSQLVSCVTLTITADYRRDKKRTKLVFEFVEANPSKAPFRAGGGSLTKLLDQGSSAVNASKTSGEGRWTPTPAATDAASDVSTQLARLISPAKDEDSFDAISALQRSLGVVGEPIPTTATALLTGAATQNRASAYASFVDVIDPIDAGTVTIRRIHETALVRLREFNHYIVTSLLDRSPPVEALLITARLALIRDYALVTAATTYQTVHAALADLDFIVAVYDDEEVAATAICDDELVRAIRAARAGAVLTIFNHNARLPGIVHMSVDGIWPSLVIAQKRYFDGRRYDQVEAYNSHMVPFFIGRDITTPAY